MNNSICEMIMCANSGCISTGGATLFEYLTAYIDTVKNQLKYKPIVKKGGCHGFCELGPTMIVGDERFFYIKLDEKKLKEIVDSHLIKGIVAEKFCYFDPLLKTRITKYDEIPLFKHQNRLLLKSSPFTDPESLEDYESKGGFKALTKAIDEYEQISLCDMIASSRLRGRGGGGFITGEKWKIQAMEISQPKYVICNGDEGDPGTFMDKYLLEGDPFRILEGVLIAGYATMSNIGIIYLRKDYDIAAKRVQTAIDTLYKKGYLGSSIMGKLFAFDIKIEFGPGAYISGEETSLLEAIESRRGTPRVKPPHPTQNGLDGKPTLINNVETFANIREIVNMGNEEYKKLGTADSPGTKLFTLSGAVKHNCLVEMEFGNSFDKLINDIGGGIQNASKLKAIQIGGASGSMLPARFINEEISFENLKKNNIELGAGGVVVLDEYTCAVEMTKYYVEFAQQESCGYCVPCREGTQRLLTLLQRITEGNGRLIDIETIRIISTVMYQTAMCGLGREAINPVLSLLDNFEDELKEHIVDKKCRAGVCPKLVRLSIDNEKCIGCGACKLNCPVNAISGIKGQYHTIDKELCIRCGVCYKICPKDAIVRS